MVGQAQAAARAEHARTRVSDTPSARASEDETRPPVMRRGAETSGERTAGAAVVTAGRSSSCESGRRIEASGTIAQIRTASASATGATAATRTSWAAMRETTAPTAPHTPAAAAGTGWRVASHSARAATKAVQQASGGAMIADSGAPGSSRARGSAPAAAVQSRAPAGAVTVPRRAAAAASTAEQTRASSGRAAAGTPGPRSGEDPASGAMSAPASTAATRRKAVERARAAGNQASSPAWAASRRARSVARRPETDSITPEGMSRPMTAAGSARRPSVVVTETSPAEVSMRIMARSPATVVPNGTATSVTTPPRSTAADARGDAIRASVRSRSTRWPAITGPCDRR